MKYRVPRIAIDNLTELALYSDKCWIANAIDDELYELLMDGFGPWPFPQDAVGQAGYGEEVNRRMYFLFMAEMLKTPWEPKPKTSDIPAVREAGRAASASLQYYRDMMPTPKPPFDGVGWLFENRWISYDDVMRARIAEKEYNNEA